MRATYEWRLRSRKLPLGGRTLVMGIVNVTPDSFSDGGQLEDAGKAVEHALRLLDEGADILDIGGESTRPGVRVAAGGSTAAVSAEEELRRVLPVIEGILRARPAAIISVDTYKAEVAQKAVDARAEIVNDVSGFAWDARMAETVAALGCGCVVMHQRGRPEEWRDLPPEPNLVDVVKRELRERVDAAREAGVEQERIVLDPGFGFGKKLDENYPLLARFGEFAELGFPLLAATSRKAFVGRTVARRISEITGKDIDNVSPGERLSGTLATVTAAILQGAHIVRVHDVRPAVEVAAVADAIVRSGGTSEVIPFRDGGETLPL